MELIANPAHGSERDSLFWAYVSEIKSQNELDRASPRIVRRGDVLIGVVDSAKRRETEVWIGQPSGPIRGHKWLVHRGRTVGTPEQITTWDTDLIFRFDWSNDGRLAVERGVFTNDIVLIRAEDEL